jgi:hypothetical protein
LYSNICGTVFCRIQEVDENVRGPNRRIEVSNDKGNRGKKHKLLDNEEEYDISTSLRKFRRIRIINPNLINTDVGGDTNMDVAGEMTPDPWSFPDRRSDHDEDTDGEWYLDEESAEQFGGQSW